MVDLIVDSSNLQYPPRRESWCGIRSYRHHLDHGLFYGVFLVRSRLEAISAIMKAEHGEKKVS